MFTVFGAAVDGRAPAGFAGIIIGFIVYGIIILVGPITGAALNPAREIGPDLVQTLIGATTQVEQLWPSTSSARSSAASSAPSCTSSSVSHETATVPGAAVAEAAHGEAVGA